MKISQKIDAALKANEPFYSFEYFPPKTEPGLANLYSRIERMAELEPTFIDITWGAGGSTSDLTLSIAETAQKYFSVDVLMHLTCTNLPKAQISEALKRAKDAGIQNILALRGDPPKGQKRWKAVDEGFQYASDLVQYIRDQHGDYFSIGVAGYPEGHLESKSLDEDILYLKRKVDCGADFIITQLFFDLDSFFQYEEKCRQQGIHCPIIPGLLPIQNFDQFKRFIEFTKIKVPEKIFSDLDPLKSNDAEVKQYGIDVCVDMCQALRKKGVLGFHFYTLNLERSVTETLKAAGFKKAQRELPWRKSTLPGRSQEDVRPIYWSNRPKSYIARTMEWDEFPNGRWGDSRSPAFGNFSDYYLLQRGMSLFQDQDELVKDYGHPKTIEDIKKVFINFCQGKISHLPWTESGLHPETGRISQELSFLNQRGFLTINSQPQVDGLPSSDPEVGWGGAGGIVYQKAYVEFFTSKEKLDVLLSLLKEFPTLTYQATDYRGNFQTNASLNSPHAVSWGVFPGKEIIQPTIVDLESFKIWKDEAFQLWIENWASLYEPDSESAKLIQSVHDTYYLVNIVENDFKNGDIFKIFKREEFEV